MKQAMPGDHVRHFLFIAVFPASLACLAGLSHAHALVISGAGDTSFTQLGKVLTGDTFEFEILIDPDRSNDQTASSFLNRIDYFRVDSVVYDDDQQGQAGNFSSNQIELATGFPIPDSDQLGIFLSSLSAGVIQPSLIGLLPAGFFGDSFEISDLLDLTLDDYTEPLELSLASFSSGGGVLFAQGDVTSLSIELIPIPGTCAIMGIAMIFASRRRRTH